MKTPQIGFGVNRDLMIPVKSGWFKNPWFASPPRFASCRLGLAGYLLFSTLTFALFLVLLLGVMKVTHVRGCSCSTNIYGVCPVFAWYSDNGPVVVSNSPSGIFLWRRSLCTCIACPCRNWWYGCRWLTCRFELSPLLGLSQNNGLHESIAIHGFKRAVFIILFPRLFFEGLTKLPNRHPSPNSSVI